MSKVKDARTLLKREHEMGNHDDTGDVATKLIELSDEKIEIKCNECLEEVIGCLANK